MEDARIQLGAARAGLAVQLGGAAGTLASLGLSGPAVLAAFARRLDLAVPWLPWHTARQRISGLAGALGTVAGTAAKVSIDVVLLAQSEVAEVAEQSPGGSSTLPHKRNPAVVVAVAAAARRAHALVPLLLAVLVAEHERALSGPGQAEWESLSELLALAGAQPAEPATSSRAFTFVETPWQPIWLRRAECFSPSGLCSRWRPLLATRPPPVPRLTRRLKRRVGEQTASPRPSPSIPWWVRCWPVRRSKKSLDPAGYLGATAVWIERALAAHDNIERALAAHDNIERALAAHDSKAQRGPAR